MTGLEQSRVSFHFQYSEIRFIFSWLSFLLIGVTISEICWSMAGLVS